MSGWIMWSGEVLYHAAAWALTWILLLVAPDYTWGWYSEAWRPATNGHDRARAARRAGIATGIAVLTIAACLPAYDMWRSMYLGTHKPPLAPKDAVHLLWLPVVAGVFLAARQVLWEIRKVRVLWRNPETRSTIPRRYVGRLRLPALVIAAVLVIVSLPTPPPEKTAAPQPSFFSWLDPILIALGLYLWRLTGCMMLWDLQATLRPTPHPGCDHPQDRTWWGAQAVMSGSFFFIFSFLLLYVGLAIAHPSGP